MVLYKADGVTPATDATGALVPTSSTDANGHYVFDNLLPGQYVVKFALGSSLITTKNASGSTTSNDSDANPVSGKTAVITLDATNPNLRPVVPADG